MHRIGAIAFGCLLGVAATAAYGQEPSADLSTTIHARPAPDHFSPGVELNSRQSATTLFRIGGFDVKAWAPVTPPHSTDADRVFATGPMWGAGG